MDPITVTRLAACHPVLRVKVTAAAESLAKQGILLRVTSGLRTYQEQDALFYSCHRADGTRDGRPWKTNARGGWSNHNFGMAVDAVPSLTDLDKPFAPCWDVAHPHFRAMVAAMKAQGLAWGGDWHEKDTDHFQLADVETTPTPTNRADYTRGGLPAVWARYEEQGTTTAA